MCTRTSSRKSRPRRTTRCRTGTVPSGHVVLLSDNPRGSDSRRWGPCPEHQVLGRVARRMS
ncbi:S26 family signal peptidase [Promicromonospora sp. NPDC060204]|uniref:S26 family signal peptidase n=1 Tax=Promicromonospora sp. NPDC060204 TaxID=3347071 RepID=UPI0036640C6E